MLDMSLVLAKGVHRAETHFSLVCISGCFEYTYNPSGQLTSATCIDLLDRAPCQAISDHDAVYMIRNMRVSKPHKLPPKILNVRNFRKFDQVAFQLDIEKIPTEQITFVSKDVNEMWLLWKTFFLDILNKHVSMTNIKVKSNHLPYVTSELRGLIRQRDYLRAKANKSGSAIIRQAFVQVRHKVNYMIKA